MIAGTSTCHMALSLEPRAVPGVWGPYYGAVAPGLWLNEGGQSATGALLDHILAWHAAGRALGPDAHARIIERIAELRSSDPDFAAGLHVLPDFHGNRSPLADPHARGVISGLTLDASLDSLARLYHRTAVAIALGTRHILDALERQGLRDRPPPPHGRPHQEPAAHGALRRRHRLHGRPGRRGRRRAARHRDVRRHRRRFFPRPATAAATMAHPGPLTRPNPATRAAYDRDYRVFLTMHDHRRALERIS